MIAQASNSQLATNPTATISQPLKIWQVDKQIYLLLRNPQGKETVVASTNGYDFSKALPVFPSPKPFYHSKDLALVEGYTSRKRAILYCGHRQIYVAFSWDKKHFEGVKKPVIISTRPTRVGNAFQIGKNIVLVFFEQYIENGSTQYDAHVAIFDAKHPQDLLWRTQQPLWQSQQAWPGQTTEPVGAAFVNGSLIIYWYVAEKILYGTLIPGFLYEPRQVLEKLELSKHQANPIIVPQQQNEWEAFNTFNPAAIYTHGKVHIFYRAQGFDYVSTVGYARSADGFTIETRSNHPIYAPHAQFECNTKGGVNPQLWSGGGYGGCEDPRITVIGNTVYMIYVAFDGWNPPRLAMTHILLQDLLAQKWQWSKPVLISRPGIIDKSGCLFPEKIHGKYVILHRVFPNILMDFVDDLNFDGASRWLKGEKQISIRPDKWDSRKIGAGAPPLKTAQGWLLIYYGVDDRDDSKYHVGAMLLDLEDPSKVLARSEQPILGPTEDYENEGFKPGIAYPCGAVIIKDQLLVYYGGADSVVCVASADLETFLDQLKRKQPTRLQPIKVQRIIY